MTQANYSDKRASASVRTHTGDFRPWPGCASSTRAIHQRRTELRAHATGRPGERVCVRRKQLIAPTVRAWSRSFFLFSEFPFTKFFQFRPAPFHEQLYEVSQDLATGFIKEATWIAHRDSGKTSLANMGLAWFISQKQMIDTLRYNGEDVSRWRERLHSYVDCYDKTNAESILLGVVTELQANDLLVADFGHLYNASSLRRRRSSCIGPRPEVAASKQAARAKRRDWQR